MASSSLSCTAPSPTSPSDATNSASGWLASSSFASRARSSLARSWSIGSNSVPMPCSARLRSDASLKFCCSFRKRLIAPTDSATLSAMLRPMRAKPLVTCLSRPCVATAARSMASPKASRSARCWSVMAPPIRSMSAAAAPIWRNTGNRSAPLLPNKETAAPARRAGSEISAIACAACVNSCSGLLDRTSSALKPRSRNASAAFLPPWRASSSVRRNFVKLTPKLSTPTPSRSAAFSKT